VQRRSSCLGIGRSDIGSCLIGLEGVGVTLDGMVDEDYRDRAGYFEYQLCGCCGSGSRRVDVGMTRPSERILA